MPIIYATLLIVRVLSLKCLILKEEPKVYPCVVNGEVDGVSEFSNPFTPKNVWLLLCPYSITLESNVKVVIMKETITDLRSS